MSAPPGSAASTSTEARDRQSTVPTGRASSPRVGYVQKLALRREADEIRRLIVYGLTLGWILALVGGFLFFCVKSRLDWLWCAVMAVGIVHLAAAVVLPQALIWPERIWMAVARWQGHLVMTLLLAVIYYLLVWPLGRLSRTSATGFYHWGDQPPESRTAWQAIDFVADDAPATANARYRGLPLLLFGVIGFFVRRGNYILLPLIVLLIVLGLVLFIVQSSVLAPFIYPLF
jgi:hypothetical protein